jgi:RNA polymerase sigma-70 factor, ECF subfamily
MTSTSDPSSTCPEDIIEATYRSEWGRLLSVLVARTRRLDLAEDALAEAFARAAVRWDSDGVPTNPSGWLYTTAWRLVMGRLRSEAIAGRRSPFLAVGVGWVPPVDPVGELDDELQDERLQLILLCCHPALPRESRSALALRLVLGTPTDEIARLFLVPTATMAARLTRAKKKIVVAGIPLASPVNDALGARLDEVCRTIYLAFTAGYAPASGHNIVRIDLASEAVRLAAVLHQLVPGATQVEALLAIVKLQHARRDARTRNDQLVILADQDRSLWHHDELRAAVTLAESLKPTEGYAEELRLQALIAAEHGRAPSAAATDWETIAARYADLEALTGSPIVRLNRAVAVAEVSGPRAGLAILEGLDEILPDNHRVAAVRAELARRAGDTRLARTAYLHALNLCSNEAESTYLSHRLGSLEPQTAG